MRMCLLLVLVFKFSIIRISNFINIISIMFNICGMVCICLMKMILVWICVWMVLLMIIIVDFVLWKVGL